MNKLRLVRYLYQYFGAGWLAYRLGYAVRARSGWLSRQIPAARWEDQPLSGFLNEPDLSEPQEYRAWRNTHAPRFFFKPEDRPVYQPIFMRWDGDVIDPCQEAGQLAMGIIRYFDHTPMQVGCPPDWHRNPFTGQTTPANQHWSQVDDFSRGDIKVIWDLSRFAFVYPLVRAYWRTGNDLYPKLFWRLVEDWRAQNPPNLGVNWKSGQEISFRVMAWCFGLYGFLDSPETTAERMGMLAQMVAVSGRRIEANIEHALSQQNNHGVSVGMGLWTIGLLFPEFRASTRWMQRGQAILESLGQDLIDDDGAFAQYSANYQRLILHDYLWAIRLGTLNDRPFEAGLIERVNQAAEFLYQVQDEDSGCLPCFGHNDGSQVLRLDGCEYSDYRPVLQAIKYLVNGDRRYPDGAWDEGLLWLFGPLALQAPVRPSLRTDLQAKQAGFYTIRAKTGFAMIHCPVYRYRPAHADPLNVDIWWRGLNVCLDPGTYSYNAPPLYDYPLARAMFHNTITVDGHDPMERVGRFLWLPWVKANLRHWQRSPNEPLVYWEGEHDGYRNLPHPVSLKRGILQLGENHWLIIDKLSSRWMHPYRLQWLLPDHPFTWNGKSGDLVLDLPVGKYQASVSATQPAEYSLMRAADQTPRGWQSLYYYNWQPAVSVDCVLHAQSALFYTLFGPYPCKVSVENTVGRVDSDQGSAQFILSPDESRGLLQSITWSDRQSGATAEILFG